MIPRRKGRETTGPKLRIRPLTPARWPDVEALFGPRGACGGCWCMVWRLPHARFQASKGAGNKRAFKRIVDAREVPGILGYLGREAVAWCAVAPRVSYDFLGRSRVLRPVDGSAVWSVSCLLVKKSHRNQGISARMIAAAVGFAASRGAEIVEGYPVEPGGARAPAPFVWTGLASAFRAAGFAEVARRSPARPIMRIRVAGETR